MLRGALIAAVVLALAAGSAAAQKAEGEIANIVGKGEYRASQTNAWTPARVKQQVFPLDWVQTLDMSKMALRFSDGATVNLDANSEFHVVKVAKPTDPKTILEQTKGRSWSSSKSSPGGMEIRTRSSLAAIRGTDWELVVDGDKTTLSVFSGEVELSNPQGSVLVAANEQAQAETGKAPVKLLLRTSRARIQWVTAFTVDPRRYAETREAKDARLKDIAAMIGDGRLSEAYARTRALAGAADSPAVASLLLSDFEIYRGDLAEARKALARGAERFNQDPRFDVAAARLALLDDDATAARVHVAAAFSKRADSVDAYVMLGDIERHEGRGREALAAYGKAAQLAAGDARGWYGLGAVNGEREDVRRARSDLSQAIALDASDPTYRAELGTVESFAGNLGAAGTDLQQALAMQPGNYVALTGLGIVELKAGDNDAALDALQKAAAIEPRYARVHVYLAAAYYRVGNDNAALFELKRAQELDPNDPLPHLLTSIIRLDRIEPGLAVEEAQEALKRIPYLKSLNQVADNQKGIANVGAPLAFMGLESWARSAAQESYLPLWGGSHLFLADRYPGDFDKRSELMQGFITDPVAFGASNRFHSLVVEPGVFGTVSMRYNQSNDIRLTEPVITLNGFDASRMPVAWFAEAVDTRIDPRDTAFSAKARTYTAAVGIRPTYELSAFVYLNRLNVDADLGQTGVTGVFDRISGTASRIDGGVRYAPDARSSFWLKGGAGKQDATDDETTTIVASNAAFGQFSHFELNPRASDGAFRHTFHARDDLEVTWGAETSRQGTPQSLVIDAALHTSAVNVLQDRLDESNRDRTDTAYAMGRWLGGAVRVELGAAWTDYRKDRDILVTRDPSRGGNVELTESYRPRKVEPLAGVVWKFAPSTLVRAACRRWIRPISLDTLAPVAVAGVPLDDQLVYAGGQLDQCRAQLEWSDSYRTFATAFVERARVHNLVSPLDGVQNTASDVTNLDRLRNRASAPVPKPDLLEDLPVFSQGEVNRGTVAVERILDPRIGLSAHYTYTDSTNTDPNAAARNIPVDARIPFLPRHQVNLGATVAPGWRTFVTLTAVYRTRRFTDEANLVPLAAGWDGQADVYWESGDKRWSAEIYALNLMKKDVSNIYGIVVSYRF